MNDKECLLNPKTTKAMSQILRAFTYFLLIGAISGAISSCNKNDDPAGASFGTITGIVTDNANHPLADVKVTVSGINEPDIVVSTGTDGKYTAENVLIKLHAVTFSKTGWLTVSK